MNIFLIKLKLLIQYLSSYYPRDGAKLAQLQISLGAFLDFTLCELFSLIYLIHS
jgi:hypothetical protein